MNITHDTPTHFEAISERRAVSIRQKPDGTWLAIVAEIRDGKKHAVTLEANTKAAAAALAKVVLTQKEIQ